MKRKVLALILAILSLSFSFVACNENEDPPDDTINWHTPYKYTLPDFETQYTEQEHIDRIGSVAKITSDQMDYEIVSYNIEIVYSFEDKPCYFIVYYNGIMFDAQTGEQGEQIILIDLGTIINDEYYFWRRWHKKGVSDIFGLGNIVLSTKWDYNFNIDEIVSKKLFVGCKSGGVVVFAHKDSQGNLLKINSVGNYEEIPAKEHSVYIVKKLTSWQTNISEPSDILEPYAPHPNVLVRARYYLPEYESEKSEQEHIDYLMANAESKDGQSFTFNNKNCTYDRLEFEILSGFNSEQKYFVAKQYANYYVKNELVNEVYEWTLGVIINDNYYVIKEYMRENDDFIDYPFVEGANKFLGMDFVRSTSTHSTGSGTWQMFFGSELNGEYTIVRQNGREISNIPDLSEFEIEFLFQDGKVVASLDNFVRYI